MGQSRFERFLHVHIYLFVTHIRPLSFKIGLCTVDEVLHTCINVNYSRHIYDVNANIITPSTYKIKESNAANLLFFVL